MTNAKLDQAGDVLITRDTPIGFELVSACAEHPRHALSIREDLFGSETPVGDTLRGVHEAKPVGRP